MASPVYKHAQPVPASVNNHKVHAINNTNNGTNHDRDLSQSLNNLSLSNQAKSESNVPASNAGDGRRRSAAPPNLRAPVRSALTKANMEKIGSDSSRRSSPGGLSRKTSMNSLYSINSATPSHAASRRGSSTPFLSPTMVKSPGYPFPGHMMEERLAPSAAAIATGYLAKELELLHSADSDQSTETVVILHDDCYGHRYSRPRASKSLLSTIVERPERIQASVMGVSMAYIRLGERYCEGKHAIRADLDPKSLPGIPFRIHKITRKLSISSAAVTNVHGSKWMEELKIMCDSAEGKLALNGNELRRPDMNRGSDAEPLQHFHQGDLYLCPESLDAFEGALGAVCEAVDTVFSVSSHKRAFVAVRPPGHHCSADFPSGFCWVNNVHVGIMHGILNHGLTHAAIIDFDLHHGDGSQAIAWQHNKRALTKNAAAWKKTSIGYFSVHDINSYPCEYGDDDKVKNASLCIDNAHGQNIWNVHLEEWKSEAEFWNLYTSKYSILLEKTRNYLRLQTERFKAAGQMPKAAIFLSAGFDASEWEGAGMQRHKVNVPTGFYARLTRDVVQIASEEGLGVEGRVISVLEGGYSDRALYSGVLSHLSGLVGVESMTLKEEGSQDPEFDSNYAVKPHDMQNTLKPSELKALEVLEFPYDQNWWSVTELDRFDAARATPPQEPTKKVTRVITMGNYSSPTTSSNAKMTEVAKLRRSFSNIPASQTIISRSPSPPPPDVSWEVAAHELSKLLIPSNRQIDSCTHSELNAEATKAKRDRQSMQAAINEEGNGAPAAPTRKSLREKKPVSYLEEEDHQSRRKTVAGPIPTQTGSSAAELKHSRQASRRLSTVSNLSTVTDAQLVSNSVTRPSTSLSTRPVSSMSVRTQSSTITMRKTRPTAPPKKPAGRAPRVPRNPDPTMAESEKEPSAATAPPLPNVTNDNGPPPPASQQDTVASGGIPPAAATAPRDLDQITNGLKRIKINVLTKEQKAARQKAKTEAAAADDVLGSKEEHPALEQPPLTPTIVEPRPDTASSESGSIQHPLTPLGAEALPSGKGLGTPTTPIIISPAEPSPSSTLVASSPAQDGDLFIPYQPDGPPAAAIPIQKPIRILDPNTGTPARPNPPTTQQLSRLSSSVPVTPMRKGVGHSFTAISNIPFSNGPTQTTTNLPRPATSGGGHSKTLNPQS